MGLQDAITAFTLTVQSQQESQIRVIIRIKNLTKTLRKFLSGYSDFNFKNIGMSHDCTSKADCFKGHWRISFLIRLVRMGLRSAGATYLSRNAIFWSISSFTMDSCRYFYNRILHRQCNRVLHMEISQRTAQLINWLLHLCYRLLLLYVEKL